MKKLFILIFLAGATVFNFGCKKESCNDGIKNQNETAVDCGGPCTICPTCVDGMQNQDETGIDCGGPCTACASCSDGIKNQNETGIDCGGSCPACTTSGNSQIGFEKTYGTSNGYEEGTFVVQTADGGYLVTGDSLRKFDGNGLFVFTLPIDGNSIMPTSDGNYIVARQYGGKFSKIDASGNILWTQSTSAGLNFMYQINDGGYIGCGGNMVIRTDASGNIVWSKQLGTSGMNDSFEAEEVRQTADGNFVIAGTQISGYGWDAQATVYKLNSLGTMLWVKYFGSTSSTDEGKSVKATADSGCVFAGLAGSGWFDMRLVKLDKNGNTTWNNTYGNSSYSESAKHVQLTSDGGYILVGYTDIDGEGNTYNVYVVKTNSSGVKTWEDDFGGSSKDFGKCIQPTSDGGYIITGQGNYSGSNSDVYLLKLK